MQQLHVYVCATVMLLYACSGPRDVAIPTSIDLWKSDKALQAAVQKLDDEEKRLFLAWSMRAGMGSAFGVGIPEGFTVGKAIAAQRAWATEQASKEAEREALAKQVAAQQQAAIDAMDKALTVAWLDMGFQEHDWRRRILQDSFSMTFAFRNNTQQPISGVKGRVRLTDMFGDEIKSFDLSMDETIPEGQVVRWSGSLDFNQFRDEDVRLRNTQMDKIKFSWIPMLYLFEDGARMEVPEMTASR